MEGRIHHIAKQWRICFGLCLLFPTALFAQTDSLSLPLLQKMDQFPAANRLLVDEEGNFIFLQTEESKLHKFISLSGYDSAIHIGGRANRAEGFLNPIEIRLQGRQVLYVLDEVARRVILLNTNFKIIDELNLIDLEAGFAGRELPEEIMPTHFDVSAIGELYLLNQLDGKANLFIFQVKRFDRDLGHAANFVMILELFHHHAIFARPDCHQIVFAAGSILGNGDHVGLPHRFGQQLIGSRAGQFRTEVIGFVPENGVDTLVRHKLLYINSLRRLSLYSLKLFFGEGDKLALGYFVALHTRIRRHYFTGFGGDILLLEARSGFLLQHSE